MTVVSLLTSSISLTRVEPLEGLATAKVVAALVFVGVLLAIAGAYRSLRRRLEVEDSEALIEAEFERLKQRHTFPAPDHRQGDQASNETVETKIVERIAIPR